MSGGSGVRPPLFQMKVSFGPDVSFEGAAAINHPPTPRPACSSGEPIKDGEDSLTARNGTIDEGASHQRQVSGSFLFVSIRAPGSRVHYEPIKPPDGVWTELSSLSHQL